MATPEELQNQKDLNQELERTARLEKSLSDLRKGDVDVSFMAVANLREIFGIKSKTRDLDRAIFNNAKAINKQLLGQETSLSNIREYSRQTLKNEKLLLESRALERAALREIGGEESERAKAVQIALDAAEARDGLLRTEKDLITKNLELVQNQNNLELEGKVDTQKYVEVTTALDKNIGQQGNINRLLQEADAHLDALISGKETESTILEDALLTEKERAAFFAQYNRKQLEANQDLRNSALEALGPTETFLGLLGAIPGLSNITNQALDKTISIVDDIITKEGNVADIKKATADAQKKALLDISKQLTSEKAIGAALTGVVLKGLFEVNRAQTEFTREVGRGIESVQLLGGSIVLASDQIRIATALTQQFGFAATSAFDSINLLAATELEQLTGLSADQAGRFALFSQTTGTSLDDNLDTIISQVGEINIANKSAVTQRQIFRDIGDTSSAIALTFQGNTVQLARAAQQARILGLTLSQVDNIAAGLLDIESSIRSEFEAEVITGQQLNLERARFFALTNDLNGLTKELAANQEIINKFATGNRIEQEAIAGALNMSRDEMADMIFQQRLQLGITDEQARLTAGLTQQDFERLSIQESISTSLNKIGETLSVVIEPVLRALSENAFALYTILGSIAGLSLAKTVISLAQMALSAGAIGVALGGLGAVVLTAGIAALAYTLFKGYADAKQVGDAIIPAGKGPIISTREGGLIQGTANDDIVMAPGVARGGRNTGNVIISDEQLQRITSAVSKAQLNINGKRASSLLQPDFAVTTYSYSV